jgi:hypothetical protein
MHSFFLTCAAAAMSLTLANAQNEGRRVNARLVYFEQSALDPTEVFYHSNGEFVKCPPSGSVSGTPVSFPVDASGKVVFTGTAAASPVIATASVPQSVSQAVFFLLRNPDPSAAVPYRILVADESFEALPKGGSFICNLAPNNARVSLGESKYLLPPGKPVFVKRPEEKDAYNMAALQMQIEGEPEVWKSLKDTMLRFSESERYFIVTYMRDGRQPAVKIYKQVVREKPSAAAP